MLLTVAVTGAATGPANAGTTGAWAGAGAGAAGADTGAWAGAGVTELTTVVTGATTALAVDAVPVTVAAGLLPRRGLADASPCSIRRMTKDPNATRPARSAHHVNPLCFRTIILVPIRWALNHATWLFFVIDGSSSEPLAFVPPL